MTPHVAAWQRVTRRRPCPVCGNSQWCLFTADGGFICCQRRDNWAGEPPIRRTDAGWLFALAEGSRSEPLPRPPEQRRPLSLPRAVLDAVYRELAARCPLKPEARADLIEKRGFPEALDTGLYFSLPRSGNENRAICSALIANYGADVIAAVPGFTRRLGELGFRSVRAGREDYAVMGLDEDGLAFWGHSRILPFDPGADDAKYMLLSSSRGGDASLAGLPKYHVAGRQYAADRVWCTEGVIKSEIAAVRLRCRVIGMYSTSVDRPTLDELTRLIRTWETHDVTVAFDADKHERDSDGNLIRLGVLAGEAKLIEALAPLADPYTAEWNIAGGKGIDDLLTAGGTYRRLSRYVTPTPRPRVPRLCAEPGPNDHDTDFRAVGTHTAERIAARLGDAAAGSVALMGPPPGIGKTGSGLRAQEASRVNVFWGVGRHEQAEELIERSRSEPCACGTARGSCSRHAFSMHHDFGRNAENCSNIEVVRAAQSAGYGGQVGRFICGTETKPICPDRLDCTYHAQFERAGSHVAPFEVVLNRPTSTAHTEAVLFDDLDSGRLVQQTRVTTQTIERAKSSTGSQAFRPLLRVLEHALAAATTQGAYHSDAYDLLEDAARQCRTTLETILVAMPPASRLVPEPTIAGYEAAPPGQLVDLGELLHEEFPLWRDGKPLTSGLRIHAGGLDVARLNTPVARANGETSLTGKAVSVFSSTPDPVLRQWMGRLGLEVQAEYSPRVALPRSVRVIQDVGAFHGKVSTAGKDNDRLLAKAKAYLDELAPARPAAITHKHLREPVSSELAIPLERVLYFGNLRGSNAVRDTDALLVIGTPGMSPTDAYWAACATFRGEGSPPSRRMVMRPLRYGGWRDAHGRGREIDVLTFVDPWVAEIYESSRRDELMQAVYRCRPFDIPELEQLDRTADKHDRRALTVVLLHAYPIAGLRVHELRFSGNAARAEEATARMDEAVARLRLEGISVSARALAAAAGASKDRANEHLQQVSTVCPPTYREVLIQVGGQGGETASDPAAKMPSRADLPKLCRGGCGKPMPAGQKCVACATAAVVAWLATRKGAPELPWTRAAPGAER